ncbi:helix-loop-helix DNA-binding domain-containing protein [Phycomyces nitens]|nr:helix-loop-helix DNA-binding domain-containing protein [Phycomyces nitens]
MYSPTQQDFNLEADHFVHPGLGTPHTTVGAMPVVRNNRVFNSSATAPYQMHQRHNSFGAVSIAMSPPHAAAAAAAAAAAGRGISFADPNAQHWFSTSLDSTGSSFGQSPIFGGRDLIVSPSTSTGHIEGYVGPEDDEHQQRNLQEIFEKRRRRRESHNAVERRRRDNINERIQELSTLLPEHLLESAPTSSNVMSTVNSQSSANGKAINKGTILKLSVDHIKDLRDEVSMYKSRIQELEQLIEAAKHGDFSQDPHPQSGLQKQASGQGGFGDSQDFYNQARRNTQVKEEVNSDGFGQQGGQNPQPVRLVDSNMRSRHERMGSLQFQQKFGNMNIGNPKDINHL